MSVELNQSVAEVHLNEVIDGVDAALIETIWNELDNQVPHERVRRVVAEIAREFQDAKVKTFVPMLVQRRALERLRQEPIEITIR